MRRRFVILIPLLAASPALAATETPGTASPEAPAPGAGSQGGNQPLSSKLAQSNGTIRPPQVDRGIVEQPREKGAMPVIPPPGTPHGPPGPSAK